MIASAKTLIIQVSFRGYCCGQFIYCRYFKYTVPQNKKSQLSLTKNQWQYQIQILLSEGSCSSIQNYPYCLNISWNQLTPNPRLKYVPRPNKWGHNQRKISDHKLWTCVLGLGLSFRIKRTKTANVVPQQLFLN